MKHLTVEDIAEFVSFTKLNSETLELAARVNTHIRECKECRELVRAHQIIHDEFKIGATATDIENTNKRKKSTQTIR